MQLSSPVRTYFDAEQQNDADTLAAAFTDDAVVRDEGAEHVGPAAIRAWWQAAKAKYRHVAEPIDAIPADGRTVVRARVTGQFPGSPATLTFSFMLAGDRIARLEIG
ncbi:nuclear transport factor 2 family protein [Rubellimicrobium roseum]|uniref:Nuclear transport factor 2 family protein n=1 Tax=Rubellimicrobium roseum TaxID=687525 RepID=A0A5C4N4G7_9RHOB|nr:nuclear transport factor 2 family protein [Rubellimicrobium roseum]TNC62869.1 nuclear transport factor 2 family protein [Rubellimicrobium roseum]